MAILDVDVLSFTSQFPIDKIAHTDTITITNPGPNAGTETAQVSRIATTSKSHPVGRRCFIRARWRIDGGTWQDMGNVLQYSFTMTVIGVTSTTLSSRIAQISIGCNQNTVYVRTANGHHGDATMNSMGGALTYTAIPHTFEIEYVMFEMT